MALATNFTSGHQYYPYTSFSITKLWIWNEGVLQIPLAAPPGFLGTSPGAPSALEGGAGATARTACKIVRKHAPVGKLTVVWIARRVGAIPLVPYPGPPDANMVLEGHQIGNFAPALEPGGQGSKTYELSGTYVFALYRPVNAALDAPTMGATSYDIDTNAAGVNILSNGAFVTGLF